MAFIERLNKKGKWGAPIVTEVKKDDQYWEADHFLRPESVLGE